MSCSLSAPYKCDTTLSEVECSAAKRGDAIRCVTIEAQCQNTPVNSTWIIRVSCPLLFESRGCVQDAVLQNGERCAAFAAEFTVYEDLWKKDMKESLSVWLAEKTTKHAGVSHVVSLLWGSVKMMLLLLTDWSMRVAVLQKLVLTFHPP